MLPTADQVRGSTAINLMGDSIAGTTQSSKSRLRQYGEFVTATGSSRDRRWSIEYRVSGWMDSCFKRWTMGGKNTLLLLRQQRTISRLDLRQKLGTMGTRWPRCFAGNLEDMARGLFGVLDAFLSSESRSESGLTRSVACHCRCRAVGAGKLLIDTLQLSLSGVDPGLPQLELSALQGEETLQLHRRRLFPEPNS